jgi:hypothetical protein
MIVFLMNQNGSDTLMTQPESHVNQSTSRFKNLFWILEAPSDQPVAYRPRFYVEARIDFNDVRTGLRETVSLSKALEMYPYDADSLWADDMARDVDPGKISSAMPSYAIPGHLPDYVDLGYFSRMETQFIQYLMRSFVVKVYRNFCLNVYSFAGESSRDFVIRCLELLEPESRRELASLQEVFNRKLEQIRQKYLGANDTGELEHAKTDSQKNDIVSQASEWIAELFLGAESVFSCRTLEPLRFSPEMQELTERLLALIREVRQATKSVYVAYEEKAQNIDEYNLHPNLNEIHFVRSCILWMPPEAA